MALSKFIQIVEVGPRDGFQNIDEYIPVETKIKIIESLVEAGVTHIQHTSFVSPKAIPQLKDAAEVTRICQQRFPYVRLNALVPNLRGAQNAWELGIKEVSYVVSLSESHNKANINRSVEQSINELENIRLTLPELDVWLDIACAFACPFEGEMAIEDLLNFMKKPYELGIRTFGLCDTIGYANPKQVRAVIQAVKKAYPEARYHVHIHDTRNMGMANTLAAIEMGIDLIETSLGGLGGCPFAPGASGNTSTEDLVFMLDKMGYETNINVNKLIKAAKLERELIPHGTYSGHQINL